MGGLLILAIGSAATVTMALAAKRFIGDRYFDQGGTLPGASKSPRQRARFWQPVITGLQDKAAAIVDNGRFGRGLEPRRRTQAGDIVPHWGIDIVAPEGVNVRAAKSGTIRRAEPINGYGNTIILQHADDGQVTLYAHLNRMDVREGQQVRGNEIIGKVGRTSAGPDGVVPSWGRTMGAHLHMEVHEDYPPDLRSGAQAQYRQGVLDPEEWLLRQGIAQYANHYSR